MPPTEEQVKRKARVLAAFMSQQEAVGFARSFALEPQHFMNEWTHRSGARQRLEPEYQIPCMEEIPTSAALHIEQLKSHPSFSTLYASADLRMIELGRLVAFQHWMDTDVSNGVHGNGDAGAPAEGEIFNRCLPVDLVPATRTLWRPEGGPGRVTFSVYSHNNTLGFEHGFDQNSGKIMFAVTAAPNLMLVAQCEGRYILMNGYHRAWWLRTRGVTMAPVVIQPFSHDQIMQQGFIQPGVMLGDRPPLIDHFLSDELALTEEVRAMLRVVRVTAEVSMVPRLL